MKCVPLALCLLFPLLAHAQTAGPIKVERAWSRAAPEGRVGVLYLTATDDGAPDRLTGVSTPVAEKAELHESLSENGVMKMRPVSSVAISREKPLTLAPGGYHVMLMGLKQPLKEGESFPVTLTFEKAGGVMTTASVEKAGAPGPVEQGATRH